MTVTEQLRIPLDKIEVSPQNPRVDAGDVTELAASIKQIGVLEPIVVVQHDGKFQAITGSRRLAASKAAGVKDIPVRVMSLDAAQAAAAGLIENLHRKDLNPMEEAQGYHEYLALTGEKPKALAARLGRVESTITNALKLLETPKPVQAAIRAGRLGLAHGLAMLKLADPGLAEKVMKMAEQYDARNEGKPQVGTTIPLRVVVDAIQRVNEEHIREQRFAALPGELKKRKEELEAKSIVVTWAPAVEHQYRESQIHEVATYLGKPPKPIAFGDGYDNMNSWPAHAKDCGCDSVALSIGRGYGQGEDLKVQTRVVCTNVAAARKRRARFGNANPNRPNKAEREKQARDKAKRLLDLGGDFHDLKGKRLTAAKKLANREIGTEVARVVLFSWLEEGFWSNAERVALWEAIAAMPLAKVKQKIVNRAVHEIIPAGFKHMAGREEKIGPHVETILSRFHITMAQAGLLPELALDRRSPAKRRADAHEKSRATQRAKANARKAGR